MVGHRIYLPNPTFCWPLCVDPQGHGIGRRLYTTRLDLTPVLRVVIVNSNQALSVNKLLKKHILSYKQYSSDGPSFKGSGLIEASELQRCRDAEMQRCTLNPKKWPILRSMLRSSRGGCGGLFR